MSIEIRPVWLVRQENGTIAEARTRAFLVDRFWVLERSADVEGADFIIQRRITQSSLLDRTPPRLGFIQVKFFASEATTQYVHREYVLDAEGNPRPEFFVMCHSGSEDAPRSFLMSAVDVHSHFQCTDADHTKPNRFSLPGKAVFDKQFEVIDRRQALDRIENAMRNADFTKNRCFASWALPSIAEDPPPILPMYNEEIDNWWGHIPSSMKEIQKLARSLTYNFEEPLNDLRTICESQDPEEVLELGKWVADNWGGPGSRMKDLFHEDLLTAVRMHKRRHEQLVGAGLLNRYAAFRRTIKARFVKDVGPTMPAAMSLVYVLKAHYEPNDWEDLRLEHRFEQVDKLWPSGVLDAFNRQNDMPDHSGTLEVKSGFIEAYIAPGRCSLGKSIEGKYVEYQDAPWPLRLEPLSDTFAGIIMEEALNRRFGAWDSRPD
jgi:hypothetical protein